ncbi:MAG: hypothetical protein J5U19_14595 [Candidatus Methanoperedens sp.]|nr:hypothetical protein [Candidatus Methanoperedens sp.]
MPFCEEDSTDGLLLPCSNKKGKDRFLARASCGRGGDVCGYWEGGEAAGGWRPEMRIEECLGMMCN